MKLTDIERRMRQVAWSAPSPALRDRVMSAVSIIEQPITWSDRMWFSRGWRLAGVAAVVAIIVVEALPLRSQPAERVATPQTLAESQLIDELGRQAGLSPDAAASLVRHAQFDADQLLAPDEDWATLTEFFTEGARR